MVMNGDAILRMTATSRRRSRAHLQPQPDHQQRARLGYPDRVCGHHSRVSGCHPGRSHPAGAGRPTRRARLVGNVAPTGFLVGAAFGGGDTKPVSGRSGRAWLLASRPRGDSSPRSCACSSPFSASRNIPGPPRPAVPLPITPSPSHKLRNTSKHAAFLHLIHGEAPKAQRTSINRCPGRSEPPHARQPSRARTSPSCVEVPPRQHAGSGSLDPCDYPLATPDPRQPPRPSEVNERRQKTATTVRPTSRSEAFRPATPPDRNQRTTQLRLLAEQLV